MSAASEEICYPGSSISRRVQSWMNYSFKTNNDWLTPPAEHEYVSAWSLHNGFSMYDWSNWIEMDDRLALYAQVSFFAQYIYTQYGNQTSVRFCKSLPQENPLRLRSKRSRARRLPNLSAISALQ